MKLELGQLKFDLDLCYSKIGVNCAKNVLLDRVMSSYPQHFIFYITY